jgi:hypothetical protein
VKNPGLHSCGRCCRDFSDQWDDDEKAEPDVAYPIYHGDLSLILYDDTSFKFIKRDSLHHGSLHHVDPKFKLIEHVSIYHHYDGKLLLSALTGYYLIASLVCVYHMHYDVVHLYQNFGFDTRLLW